MNFEKNIQTLNFSIENLTGTDTVREILKNINLENLKLNNALLINLKKSLSLNEIRYLILLKKKFNTLNMQDVQFDLLETEKVNFFSDLTILDEKSKISHFTLLKNIIKLNTLGVENIKLDNLKIKRVEEKRNKSIHYPSSVREWNNSIYLYNKNNLNLVPSSAVKAMKIIKGFFNIYNQIIERKMRSKRLLLRFRKLSSNRIYLSKAEFKHSNNNVLINIYLFNRQKYNYLLKLKNIFLKKKNLNQKFIKLLKLVYFKGLDLTKEIHKDKHLLVKALNILEKNNKYKINTFKTISNLSMVFYKKTLKLTMRKLRLYFFYKQLLFINKSKLNYNFLHLLKKNLEKLYNKNVEFNLINLKLFYLNSDILSESVKLKLTKNRKIMRHVLNRLKNKIKIYRKRHFLGFFTEKQVKIKMIKHTNLLKQNVISQLKYRHITGYRLEASGRLSRRHTASRSVHKVSYKGNLLNIDSSYRAISCVILRGDLRSNLQYSKVASKTRIGSYGLKGWVSGN